MSRDELPGGPAAPARLEMGASVFARHNPELDHLHAHSLVTERKIFGWGHGAIIEIAASGAGYRVRRRGDGAEAFFEHAELTPIELFEERF